MRTSLSALTASIILCGIRPAEAARRSLNVSFRMAAVIHTSAGLAAVFLLIAATAWADGQPFSSVWEPIARQFERYPKTAVLTAGGLVLLIEAGFVWLAFSLMPWGAVDEPLRASFSHAMRRVWCQTPHATLVILVLALLTAYLGRLNAAWAGAHPIAYPPQPLPIPAKGNMAPVLTPAWTAHGEEVRRIDQKARAAKPWYLRYGDAIAVDFGFLCGIWFLGAMLRAVGVPRAGRPMPRQPRCDACGYDLTLMPIESRCPECGEPVAASLGPDVRPGTPWSLRQVPAVAAWWQTVRTAVVQPTVLGRMLPLRSPGTAHRCFLLMHMPIIFVIGAASLPTLYYVLEGHSPFPNDAHLVLTGSPIFGTLCMVGTLLVSLGSASRCGLLHQFKDKRNLLTGAVQVVSYLVVYLVAWQVFGAVSGIGAVAMGQSDWFERLTLSRRAGPEVLAFFLWLIPNLACGLWYWSLVKKAVAATRFANR